MAEATYAFSMDWADDGFKHTAAAIPVEHVWRYLVDWGSTLDAGSSDAGVSLTSPGVLTLFDAGGLYVGLGALTPEQLQRPHKWRLAVQGVVQREGRAVPVLGTILGEDVQPVTWRLEGPNVAAGSSEVYVSIPAGPLSLLLGRFAAAGIEVVTDAVDRLRGIEWRGLLAGGINLLGSVLGARAIEMGDGRVRLVRDVDAQAAEPSVTVDASWGISVAESGAGVQASLVRTAIGVDQADGTVRSVGVGDSARWGARSVRIPRWVDDDTTIIPNQLNVVSLYGPHRYVQFGLLDDDFADPVTLTETGDVQIGRGIIPWTSVNFVRQSDTSYLVTLEPGRLLLELTRDQPPPPPLPAGPTIDSFTARATGGGQFFLEWSVTGAVSGTLSNNLGHTQPASVPTGLVAVSGAGARATWTLRVVDGDGNAAERSLVPGGRGPWWPMCRGRIRRVWCSLVSGCLAVWLRVMSLSSSMCRSGGLAGSAGATPMRLLSAPWGRVAICSMWAVSGSGIWILSYPRIGVRCCGIWCPARWWPCRCRR